MNKERETKIRKQFVLPVILCVICILMNMFGKWCTGILELPIYLDTPGTILASVLGGYIPGIFVALCTNMLNYYSDSVSIYYGVLNIMIAVLTCFASERLEKCQKKKVLPLVLYLVFLALIGGGIGGCITLYLYGSDVNKWNRGLIEALGAIGIGETGGWYVSTILYDLLDKILTVFFIQLVLFLIPKEKWNRFKFLNWMQEPIVEEQIKKDETTSRKQRSSLSRKIVSLLVIFSVIIACICTTVCLILFRSYSVEQHKFLAMGVANMVAFEIDGDKVEEYLEKGEAAQGYRETEQQLANIRQSSPDIQYVYVYQIRPDGCHVVFDIDTEDMEGGEPGEIIPFDESFEELLPSLLRGEEIEPIITDDTYGWLLTVYVPVYDSEGYCVCYAATDVSMTEIRSYEMDFLVKLVCVFFGFLFFALAVGLWLAQYHLILPINAISNAADHFEYDDEHSRKENVEKLAALDIRTGDEVERLYQAFLATTKESTQYFEENKKKAEKIDALQSGLVMVLADLVENRDEATGDHVRKTAAYVGLTADKMRSLGYYDGQITDEFIRNCMRSAPLHDVGKIAIPDAILNKPGKLTEDEYTVMKTHAPKGRDVIEQAIATIPEADYLEEAKNMAGAHHEKWNGTGYPDGLKEEQIPLSARIMAVADVFDALVSARVYKPPFTYEDAFEIIENDAGTHFDPLVVDAFLKSKDEVIAIADRFAAQNGKVDKKDD